MIRVVNVITRMIVGGPMQVCLLAGRYYRGVPGFEYRLLTGPESGAEGDYFAELDADGTRYQIVPSLQRAIAPLVDARALAQLVAALRRLRPHVVHARTAKARFLGPLAARLAGVPVVVQTVHGWSFNNAVDSRRPLYVRLEKLARRFCDCTVLVSEQDRDEGRALGVLPPSVETAVIRSGVDLSSIRRAGDGEREALRQAHGAMNGRPVVSLVQRLSEPKTPLVFVEALRAVTARHPHALAWIVGDGKLREPTERAVAQAGLGERVRFLGLRKDIPAVLTASDVVVHSSLREGLPRVVLETLAVGTPLVATAVGGVPEVVRDGENGLLVPAEDAAALARAITAVLDDPAAASARARRGPEAVHPFSAQRMLDEQHALYLRLLQRKGLA